jgi:hypothetical protein
MSGALAKGAWGAFPNDVAADAAIGRGRDARQSEVAIEGGGAVHRGAVCDPVQVFAASEQWLLAVSIWRPIFVSDNPAFEFQWINYGFHHALGHNPFGHSSGRRISDFYADLVGDCGNSQV